MRKSAPGSSTITRRRLIAAAAAGTLAIAAEPASAQRCPATPPAWTKGPPVWLDLDQQDLDDAYEQSVYAFNAENIRERRDANNEKVLTIIGKPQRVGYGPAEIETLDIYQTRRPNAPVLIFIHGGAWRGGRSCCVMASILASRSRRCMGPSAGRSGLGHSAFSRRGCCRWCGT